MLAWWKCEPPRGCTASQCSAASAAAALAYRPYGLLYLPAKVNIGAALTRPWVGPVVQPSHSHDRRLLHHLRRVPGGSREGGGRKVSRQGSMLVACNKDVAVGPALYYHLFDSGKPSSLPCLSPRCPFRACYSRSSGPAGASGAVHPAPRAPPAAAARKSSDPPHPPCRALYRSCALQGLCQQPLLRLGRRHTQAERRRRAWRRRRQKPRAQPWRLGFLGCSLVCRCLAGCFRAPGRGQS